MTFQTRLFRDLYRPRKILLTAILFLVSTSLLLATFQFNQTSVLAKPVQTIEDNPQFDFDLLYAYVGKGNETTPHAHFNGTLMYPRTLYPTLIRFNFTHISDVKAESCDAKLEVYQIQLLTDTGITENYVLFAGTNCKSTFSDLNSLTPIILHIDELVDLEGAIGMKGCFRFDWTTNNSIVGSVGSLGSYASRPSKLGLWSAGEPNSITITVRRQGWILMNDTAILPFASSASADNIIEVQLEKFGNGLIYNKLVPDSELSLIDPFKPPM